jgi:predicted metalloprotease with PDZ domain
MTEDEPTSNQTTKTMPKRGSVNLNYHLAIQNPANHDIEVSILVEDHNDSSIEFVMPTWAPGRLVRGDYAALVSEVSARGRGAKTLRMTRVGANRWRVAASGEDLVFKYRIHAARLSDGSSFLNDQGGIINPASVCMYVEGRRSQSLGVYVGLPESTKWSSYSAMESGDGVGRFTASNYGELIQSPILLGQFSEHKVPYGDQVARIYVSPQGSSYSNNIAEGVQELLEKSIDYFGAPKQKLDMFLGFAFGLGHGNQMQGAGPDNMCIGSVDKLSESSVKNALLSAASLMSRARLHDSIQLADWNAVDFDQLMVNPMSWFPKAMGNYFGLHLMQQCGLTSEFGLRSEMAARINKVESEPSKRRITLTAAAENLALMRDSRSSFLPTNQSNQFFDAYDRGLVNLLLLDLAIIGDSDGEKGLSALVQNLEQKRGVLTQRTFLSACSAIGGSSLKNLADGLMNDIALRPYDEISQTAGFLINADVGSRSQLGASMNGTKVVSVARNTSASRAGLQAGDQVSRFAGKNVGSDLMGEVAAFPAGTSTTITVVRRGSLVTLPIELTEIRRGGFRFEEVAGGNKTTRARFYGNAIAP